MENAQLIQRCLAGDQDGIQEFVAAHHRPVYRLALALLKDSDEADDAAQEVLITALSSLDSFRGGASLTTWLYRITVNHCQNRLRRQQARQRLVGALHSLFRIQRPPHPEQVTLQHETDRQVHEAVSRLGDKHRLPVLLHYYYDCSVAEIAAILEIRPGTVLSRLYTARERLHAELAGKIELHRTEGIKDDD